MRSAAAPAWAAATRGATAALGRSPLSARVSRFGLGCAGMGELFRPMPEKEAAELVRVAHEDLGVTLFDTAPFYG